MTATSTPTIARRFDLIVFDWDGTLYDSTAVITRSIQESARDLGIEVPSAERASYVIGLGLKDALEYAVPGLPRERYPELGARFRHHYMAQQHALVLFDGTLAMLEALKARHHWLAVATGKSRKGLDEALDSVHGHLRMRELFDGSRTADETRSKPDPTMLLELMREFGAEPSRTLMVGDTTHDLQLAVNAGTERVGVSYGAHEADAFTPFAPLHVAHSTADLHDWLIRHA